MTRGSHPFDFLSIQHEIPSDSINVERRKHDIYVFQLSLCSEPTAINPYQTEWQPKQHGRQLPALNNRNRTAKSQSKSKPFQHLLKVSLRRNFHFLGFPENQRREPGDLICYSYQTEARNAIQVCMEGSWRWHIKKRPEKTGR